MPLILAGLLPLVSLGAVATMDHGDNGPVSIATEPERGALTSPRDDAGFGGGVLDEVPAPDAGPGPEGAEAAAEGDGDDGDSPTEPGKTEDSPGEPRTQGEGEGRGQDNADEKGEGPDSERDTGRQSPD